MYGQSFMLVHVDTDLCLTCVTSQDVELRPRNEEEAGGRLLPQSAHFFTCEPRYKLRALEASLSFSGRR